MSGCCGPPSISQCFHGQQWSSFQPVVLGFGTSPPVCAECVLMREVRHELMDSGFPSHKPLETPRNLVRRISYLLLTSYSGSFFRRVSGKPWFLFSFSLLFLPTSSQRSLFCSYVCGADILRGIEVLLNNHSMARGALVTGIESLVWNCVLGLRSVIIPLLRVNRLHQLPQSNSTISLPTHVSVRCCGLQSEQWCLTKPWTSGWNTVLLMQAVHLRCSWPANYLGFEWTESLEFDEYFRP